MFVRGRISTLREEDKTSLHAYVTGLHVTVGQDPCHFQSIFDKFELSILKLIQSKMQHSKIITENIPYEIKKSEK